MDILSIGQVARRAGIGVETVRFYEREGLLEEPPRRASGYRQYSEEVVTRLRFIKRAQQLGFSLYVFVRAGLEPPPGQHLCTIHPAGIIETSDGAQVWFDARGYGLRGADQGQPHLWRLTMAIQFTTTDRRYQWLNTTLGVAVSELDKRAGRALWRAFIP